MLIRRAKLEDIGSICEVDARAFGQGPYAVALDISFNRNWRQERKQRIEDYYRTNYGLTFVAIVEDRVIGFAGYMPISGKIGIIHNNAVDPEYQRRGISTALILRLLEELVSLGCERIKVNTRHVPAAVRTYEKVGFKIIKEHDVDLKSLELDVKLVGLQTRAD